MGINGLINTIAVLQNNIVAVTSAASAAVLLTLIVCTVILCCYYFSAFSSINLCELNRISGISLDINCLVVAVIELTVAVKT